MKRVLATIFGLLVALAAYAHWPTEQLPDNAQADAIVVYKSERRLILLRNGETLKEYTVSLGGSPVGPKTEEDDERTPEGSYRIDYRKMNSSFHLALHISYPNAKDSAAAAAREVAPGGLIMIHGIRNGLGFLGRFHRLLDWTNGCIAVTNEEIEEIARAVPDGTPIDIHA
jgi:murein L,D-transpeptidase YafK